MAYLQTLLWQMSLMFFLYTVHYSQIYKCWIFTSIQAYICFLYTARVLQYVEVWLRVTIAYTFTRVCHRSKQPTMHSPISHFAQKYIVLPLLFFIAHTRCAGAQLWVFFDVGFLRGRSMLASGRTWSEILASFGSSRKCFDCGALWLHVCAGGVYTVLPTVEGGQSVSSFSFGIISC